MNNNRVKVTLYIEPEKYQILDSNRNPRMSRSEYFAGIIEKSIGMTA